MSSPIWGIGPVPCKGMIVGEAPGAEEEIERLPFVGNSGRLLNEALEAAGLGRNHVYVTNVYKLRPENNRTPTEAEIVDHDEYLKQEIEDVKPEFVLTLGNVARFAFTGLESGISAARGEWVNGHLLPTWHPSYVLRQGGRDSNAGAEFFRDVKEFVDRAFGIYWADA